MKKIDLEQLKRKNIYRIPPNLFKEVQNNVLKQTINNKIHHINFQNKINIKIWQYAAAILILGFGISTITIVNKTELYHLITQNTKQPNKNIEVELQGYTELSIQQLLSEEDYNVDFLQTNDELLPSFNTEYDIYLDLYN